jgi:predicted metal-dependent phosphoesterase TrpH
MSRRKTHPLEPVLRAVTPGCCPRRLNFHCHTVFSDGSLKPEDLAQQAMRIGLEHLAVTDHHSTAAYAPAAAWLARAAAQGHTVPQLWRGVEISALLDGCLVHVLALGFAEHHPSLEPYLQGNSQIGTALRAEAVLEAIHAAEGLAVLAHPARYRLPFKRLIASAAALGFDGAEAWYDYTMGPQWQPTDLICGPIASDLTDRGLLMSCGTDTHGLDLCGR